MSRFGDVVAAASTLPVNCTSSINDSVPGLAGAVKFKPPIVAPPAVGYSVALALPGSGQSLNELGAVPAAAVELTMSARGIASMPLSMPYR